MSTDPDHTNGAASRRPRGTSDDGSVDDAAERQIAFLGAALDTVPVLISYVDRDGIYRYNNKLCEDWFGFEFADFRGRALSEVVGPEGFERTSRSAERALAGESTNHRNVLTRRDGSKRDVETTFLPHRGEDGAVEGFFILSNDITDRVAFEGVMRTKQDGYRGLVEQIRVIPWIADPRTFRFIYVGPQAETILGYPADDWYAEGFWRGCIYPDDRERSIAICRTATARCEDHDFEYRMVAQDGSVVWLRDMVTVISEDGAAVALQGVMIDITAQKEAEEARRESEARYLKLFELSPDAFYVHVDDEIVFANAAAAELFGAKRPEDLIGRKASGFHAEDEHDLLARRREQAARDGTVVLPTLFRLKRLNGVEFLGEGTGSLVLWEGASAIIVHTRDVTARVHAEAALRQSELRYRRLFELSPDGIYVHVDDRIEFANPVAARMFGYADAAAMSGKSALGLYHKRHWPALRMRRARTKRGIGGIPPREFTLVRTDGSEFDGECFAAPLNWGDSDGLLVVVHDITEQRRSIEELETARRNAESANEAKSSFLAMMSHEIRTPMNGVLGMAGLLGETKLSADQRDCLNIIRDSGNALLDVINDILDFSKMEAGRMELEIGEFDIRELVDGTCKLLRAKAEEKKLSLFLDIRSDVPERLEGDQGRVRQVLLNLIGNAIKFTETGSVSVSVSTRGVEDKRTLVGIEVRDTGVGIPAGALEILFDPFTQVDNSLSRQFGGTGLGLSISRQLCELMDGTISVESRENEGSMFRVVLPFAEVQTSASADRSAALRRAGAAGGAKGLRILVAEDNHINQKVTLAMLATGEHRVDVVANGLEAVEAIRRRPYDLVLMDINMPEMDGVQATKAIRALPGPAGRVPIIALSANAMIGDRERYLIAGMDDYVAKPVDPVQLFHAITRQRPRYDREIEDPS